MSSGKQTGNQSGKGAWTPVQAYVLAVVCLLLGVAVGYLVRGSSTQQAISAGSDAQAPAAAMGQSQMPPQQFQMQQAADTQAAPLLERLKSDPNNAELLANIGNVYYDAQQYNQAITYYGRSLQVQPANTSVRTDFGTAYWYLGDPDRAISEFQTALKTDPTKANTLFNLGIVEWQGKMDGKAALAAWNKLLETNPSYENKDKVQQLIAEVQQHSNIKPGTKTDKPAM